MINSSLQSASYAAKSVIHSTMKLSPGALSFGRDMMINMPIIADFATLRQNQEALINKNLIRENRKRISHDYQVGNLVARAVYRSNKLEP